MFTKLKQWFKPTSKPTSPQKASNSKVSTRPNAPKEAKARSIEASRIGELGEYKINIQLDQLPKETKYISDIMIPNPKSQTRYSQIDHVVISPYGLFVIETKNYNGEIKGTRSDKYWRVSNRFNMYNPLRQNYGHMKALELVLHGFPGLTYISMISFTLRCRFSIDPDLRKIESNELIVYDTELSEFIDRKMNRLRQTSATPLLTTDQIQKIYDSIANANIQDAALRAAHIGKIKQSH
ncbi:NERD nuclease [Bacillus sp. FJAT-27264]|uniref:nuclease-related domain-containing protein n=1 Tax=Paenibacillus sp. (strain DSM 101736 / FJAT-27264) TaxID=1850362 RepID=UPI000807F9CD|nr:nuclease-related domain-containing protein [Bacillus sp. FJAT-27264]OBZ18530.1 NERD nuclease [Bacillus sp. FJAT-27264]